MPELRGFSERDVIKILQRLVFVLTRIKGSHAVMRNLVPLHNELATGTLRSVLRQADISPEEFLSNVN